MPDQKLTEAREEIKAVMKKHDVCGMVMLSSPTHTNYLFQLQTSWNCLVDEQDGDFKGVRFRCLRKDYPTKEAWQESQRVSVGVVMGFLDCAHDIREQLATLVVMLAKHGVVAEHMSKSEGPL